MNFFEHQDKAKGKSKRLLWIYVFALIVMVTLIGIVPALVVPEDRVLVFLGTSGIVLLIAGVSTAVKFAWLNKGGPHVAESLGGRRVNPATREPQEAVLINVVEEMSIASGCPMPSVYLLEGENSINAFAAGLTIDNAAIAVTKGCLNKLTRDELQGVVAHEYSHIIHGDMRINLRLIGTIAGITTLAYIGEILFRAAGRGGKDDARAGGGLAAIGLVFFIGGWIGVFFGSIIKAMVSRQREYLADAAAVQYTRSQSGITGALKKIGGFTNKKKIKAANARDVSHMFFSKGISSLFASHPPLEDRIRRIDANWQPSQQLASKPDSNGSDLAMGFTSVMTPPTETTPVAETMTQTIHVGQASDVINRLGEISPEALGYAADLRGHIPRDLLDAAHDVYTSRALIVAFLLDSHDSASREKQGSVLQAFSNGELVHLAERYEAMIVKLDRRELLPLFEISRHSLNEMSESQGREFLTVIKKLVQADSHISMFEWVLFRLTERTLNVALGKAGKEKPGRASIASLHTHASQLLSVLCHAGHDELSAAEKAFEAARIETGWHWLDLAKPENATAISLDGVIQPLSQLRPSEKQMLISAAICCAMSDGDITVTEGELLRATSELLGCPMAPLG